MKRYLYNYILEDLKKKMVFISGPRQVGKTFLAKQLMQEFEKPQYLNYDNINDLKIIKKMSWAQNSDLLVFDEIHKMKNWKNYIKGVYDSKRDFQSILVTVSARLDTIRQTGDSLAGRYFNYRLNPFSVKELNEKFNIAYDAIEHLLKYGGFPEPSLNGINLSFDIAERELARWQNQYYEGMLKDDILEFGRISELNTMKTLIQLLRSRVGSPLSFNSLSLELQVSVNTIKKYVQILEGLFLIFIIRPFHKNVARSLLKEPKVYFYDSSYVLGDMGIKLENLTAVHLLKLVQFLKDVKGESVSLNYLKTKDGKEVDFALTKNEKLINIIEVKLSDDSLSSSLKYFHNRFEKIESIQLVHNLHQNQTINNISIVKAGEWLNELEV